MMKKIISFMFALLLCIAFATSVCASKADEYFILDDADLLTDAEEATLGSRLEELSHTYEAQIVIATVDSLEGTDVDTYLNATYDSLKLGYGANYDGIFLLVCMNPREYRILSNGFADDAIGTSRIETIGDAIVTDLTDGNYADAFGIFADKCEYYLDGHVNGFPFKAGRNLLIALVVGFVLALIITGVWKGQLKSVRQQKEADAYVKADSLQITQSGDYFMYRNVSRTQKQQSSSSGSSGSSRSTGGGSF